MRGLLIGAPASGSGKTSVTLGLLRALRRQGVAVASAKAGPDYIDPAFHAAASGAPCVNLDPWAMRPELLRALAAEAAAGADILLVEGMMGLFDAAADGRGSSADLAEQLGLSVLLVVDCAKQSHSVAALVRGFRDHGPATRIAGLILNRVGSPRHEALLRGALAELGIAVLGVLPARGDLRLPERHLGLVQAGEHPELEAFLNRAADWIEAGVDLAALRDAAATVSRETSASVPRLPPPGQRVAVASDRAFAFSYPHLLAGWRSMGAELSFFSPLADEAPGEAADAVFLPGGYPELHAGRLASAERFRAGCRMAAERGAAVYGECGGYMVLGETLEDASGQEHAMLGLLPLRTSFKTRHRHLGYRRASARPGFFWTGALAAHEFHYATVLSEGPGDALFDSVDAAGAKVGAQGLMRGRVAGSFLHVIDGAGA